MRNKEEKGLLIFILFVCFIVILIIGGNYLINNKNKHEKTEDKQEIIYLKKDDNKDFIYFTNIEEISNDAQLIYEDININLDSDDARNIEQTLNDNMNKIRNKFTKISEQNISEDEELLYTYDDIYEAPAIDYIIKENDTYLTIETDAYIYSAKDGASDATLSYYVFDKTTGKLLDNNDIIKQSGITADEIRQKIYNHIKNDASIDVDVTMNNHYILTYNEETKVVINIIVKTEILTYNDSIIID